MKRKFALVGAFAIALTCAVATKASPKTTYYKLTDCVTTIPCGQPGHTDCGYTQLNCQGIIAKKLP